MLEDDAPQIWSFQFPGPNFCVMFFLLSIRIFYGRRWLLKSEISYLFSKNQSKYKYLLTYSGTTVSEHKIFVLMLKLFARPFKKQSWFPDNLSWFHVSFCLSRYSSWISRLFAWVFKTSIKISWPFVWLSV